MSQLTFGTQYYRIKVFIPSVWWNHLTYNCETLPETGVRVLVPLGIKRPARIGISAGEFTGELDSNIRIRRVKAVVDSKNYIDDDLLDLLFWCGRESLCGVNKALDSVLPYQFSRGHDFRKRDVEFKINPENKFTRINFYNPLDSVRNNFYIEQLRNNNLRRCLVLFSRREDAYDFHKNLPEDLQTQALLWRGDTWKNWQSVYAGDFRIVIAPPGGVFAPFKPELIILDNESEYSCCVLPIAPELNIRDIAERRAEFLNAIFITGGRVPSSKIFKEFSPQEFLKTERDKIILTDINYSNPENLKGIEEDVLLTNSLNKHTLESLAANKNVFWILNRQGIASEIFCQSCGEILTCHKCGTVLRAEDDGKKLRCPVCGKVENFPEHCLNCGSELFSGRRAGLETWLEIAKNHFPNVYLYEDRKLKFKKPALILGTSSILNFCAAANPDLIAWLNIDSELSKPDYMTRFNVFNNLWSSYWRNREKNSNRKILIQARSKGLMFAKFLIDGWRKFWLDELKTRRDLELPPYFDLYRIECDKRNRDEIINNFERENFFVMDGGDDKPIWINTEHFNLERIYKILEPYFNIQNDLQYAPIIKIFKE